MPRRCGRSITAKHTSGRRFVHASDYSLILARLALDITGQMDHRVIPGRGGLDRQVPIP